jgi:GNAT superfamily N-acetyltransferase
VVAGGASVGFMLPIDEAIHETFWRDMLAGVTAGTRVLLVARDAGRIVGTVQLELAQRPNGRHRCELQKLLVLRSHRRRGIAAALLNAAEDAARAQGRSLIVLDSGASGNALGVYDRTGYTRVGVIPQFALEPDGPYCDTVVYYKLLEPIAPNGASADRAPFVAEVADPGRHASAAERPGSASPATMDQTSSMTHP